jgi:hypothetical protein
LAYQEGDGEVDMPKFFWFVLLLLVFVPSGLAIQLIVHGTEYFENDDGTTFLQLVLENGTSVNDALCEVTIFYPDGKSVVHPVWIENAEMMLLNITGSPHGIYYYDFVTPSLSGLYMIDAVCYYNSSVVQYYSASSQLKSTRNITVGTYYGDTYVLNDASDGLYTRCTAALSAGNRHCDSWYEWTVGLNVTSLYVDYLGETYGSGLPVTTFYYWNWVTNAWVALPNTLTFHATASSIELPSGIDEYQSNNIPNLVQAISSLHKVRIRTDAVAGSVFNLFTNWLVLRSVNLNPQTSELKGSGEIHVQSITPVSESNRFYKVNTCGGFADGRCGVFTNDGEFDTFEGEIEDYLNVTAIVTRNGVDVYYLTPFSLDCTALYWVKEWNGSAWVAFDNYTLYSKVSDEDCIVTLHLDVSSGEDYVFWFKMDNYMRWEVDYSWDAAQAVNHSIRDYCPLYNYSVPITNETVFSGDYLTAFCHRTFDDLYWIFYYYNTSLGVAEPGLYSAYLSSLRFYRNELFSRYSFIRGETEGLQQNMSLGRLLVPAYTGVLQVAQNGTMVSSWNFQGLYPVVVDGFSCVVPGSLVASGFSGSQFNVSWDADLPESQAYIVRCFVNVSVPNISFSYALSVSQAVYVTKEASFWSYLQNIYIYASNIWNELLGIEAVVNSTRDDVSWTKLKMNQTFNNVTESNRQILENQEELKS